MTSWPDTRPTTRRVTRSGFAPADTTPAPRAPRTFIATPSTSGGGPDAPPRPFTGIDLPRGAADTEALAKVRESARAAGWAQGLRQAAERAAAELDAQRRGAQEAARRDDAERRAARERAETALPAAAGALRAERNPSTGALADTVLELALDLAGAVLDREVGLMASPVAEAVRRALRPLDEELPVTVRVHPSDLSALTGDGLKGGPVSADAERVTYLPDTSLSPGDAIARQGDTEVDAGLRASVSRALEALVGSGGGDEHAPAHAGGNGAAGRLA